MMLSSLILGCTTTVSTVILVPLAAEQTTDSLTVAPNRNGNNLGTFNAFRSTSTATLITRELVDKLQQENNRMLQRSPAEIEAVTASIDEFFDQYVLFYGRFISDFSHGAKLDWYDVGHIYLIDDKGDKYLPELIIDATEQNEDLRLKYQHVLIRNQAFLEPKQEDSLIGNSYFGAAWLIFPRQAISSQVRMLALNFVAFQRLAIFTWLFDKDYKINAPQLDNSARGGLPRLWRAPDNN